MKKFLCVLLSLSLAFALPLTTSAVIAGEDTVTKSLSIISKDMETGEVTDFIYTYREQDAKGKITYGWSPTIGTVTADVSVPLVDGVVGNDDRVKVSDTEAFPHSAVCYIESKINGNTTLGTAFMIGNNIAVTAGHCVYKDGYLASEVKVWPGKDGFAVWNNPFGTAKSISVAAHDYANSGASESYDWAVIILKEDIGDECGWFGIASDTSDMTSRDMTCSGYPGEHRYYQYTQTGRVPAMDSYEFYHDFDITGGQSGSPFYNSQNVVYGIATRSVYNSVNAGCLITPAMYSFMVDCINIY